MAYQLDLSHDLEVMHGLDTFTLKVAGQADVALPSCVLTEPTDTHEMEPTAGQVPQMDQLIIWPIYRSPTQPPLGSCLVDADGIYWTILAIRRKQHVDTWEAHCRNLSIMAGTINQVTLLRAVYRKGRANEARPIWKGLFSGQHPPTSEDVIPGRFQPAMELAQIKYGAEFTRETYRVVLDRPLPLELAGGEYRMVNQAGERFRVLEYFQEQRIDKLPVCLVAKIVEGGEYWPTPPSELSPPAFPS